VGFGANEEEAKGFRLEGWPVFEEKLRRSSMRQCCDANKKQESYQPSKYCGHRKEIGVTVWQSGI
jgi:hypothetical protein